MTRYSLRQRGVALTYGVACHSAFGVGIVAMIAGLHGGMRIGLVPALHGPAALAVDVALLAQFAAAHSLMLSARGRRWLARLVPLGLGGELQTTVFALVASVQLAATFLLWMPLGSVWWEAHGALRTTLDVAYGASWLLLMKAMADAGLALQTGFLGWGAVVRDRAPAYGPFPQHGTFRVVRQPIYVAFACTLWTGPVWTPDHLLLALLWTAYCFGGAALKERRYLGWYGDAFRRYRARVPYWLPGVRWLDPAALERSDR